jgi:dynein light chain LC8-type
MSEKKRFRSGDAVVNVCSMPPGLAEEVVMVASKAYREEMTEAEMATAIKRALAARHPAEMWQVIVGRSFGSYVTHEAAHFIYFYLEQTGFLVWAA